MPRPTAKSLTLDLLSSLRGAAMPVAALVAAARLFRIDANALRVAIARLLAAEQIVRDERGQYRLGEAAHAIDRRVLGWRAADHMWRAAGGTAVDYNHYTKRAILGGIYSATLVVFVNDESEGKAETRAFLDRRIEGVMKFEKAKARWFDPEREHFSMARFLGRLRYPAR